MNRITKFVGVAIVAALVSAAGSNLMAGCFPAKAAGTFGNGSTAYWIPPAPANEGAIAGRFWQQGSRNLGNEGTCAGFMYFYGPGINFYQNLGNACTELCPATRMLAVAQVPSADNEKSFFLAASIDEVFGPPTGFPYETLGNLNLIEMPKPAISSSARAAGVVDLVATIPSVSAGLYGPGAATAVTGYRVLSASGGADPGRLASAYPALEASVASTGGAATGIAFDVDCANPATDRWVVTQVVFDSNFPSDLVSSAVRVNCNPSIAEPGMPTIDKPGKGKGRPSARP